MTRHPLPAAFCYTKMLLLAAMAFDTPAAHAQSGSAGIPGSALDFGGGIVGQQLTRQSFVDQASGISVRENAYEIRIELEADVLFDSPNPRAIAVQASKCRFVGRCRPQARTLHLKTGGFTACPGFLVSIEFR